MMNRVRLWFRALVGPRGAVFLGILVLGVMADQSTKEAIRASFSVGDGVVLYGGDLLLPSLALEHVRNPGGPLSMLAWVPGMRIVFGLVVLVVSGACFELVVRSEGRRLLRVPFLGLIAGGAVGNGLDRLVYGSVTDFVLFRFDQPWLAPVLERTIGTIDGPVFNGADVLLGAGLVLLAFEQLVAALGTLLLQLRDPPSEVQ